MGKWVKASVLNEQEKNINSNGKWVKIGKESILPQNKQIKLDSVADIARKRDEAIHSAYENANVIDLVRSKKAEQGQAAQNIPTPSGWNADFNTMVKTPMASTVKRKENDKLFGTIPSIYYNETYAKAPEDVKKILENPSNDPVKYVEECTKVFSFQNKNGIKSPVSFKNPDDYEANLKTTLEYFTNPESDGYIEGFKDSYSYYKEKQRVDSNWEKAKKDYDDMHNTYDLSFAGTYTGGNVIEDVFDFVTGRGPSEFDTVTANYNKAATEYQQFYEKNPNGFKKSAGYWLDWGINSIMSGVSGSVDGVASTGDFIFGNMCKAFGWENNPFSKFNNWTSSEHERYAQNAQEQSQVIGGVASLTSEVTSGVVQMLPTLFLGYGMAGAGGTTGAIGTGATAANSTSMASAVKSSITTYAKNPMYWNSFVSTVGTDYEQAIKNGASETEATLYALFTSSLNAAVEIGGGIETLPGDLKNAVGKPNRLWNYFKSSFEEGGEEVIQKLISDMNSIAVYGNDPLEGKSVSEYVKETAYEGVMGVLVSAVVGGANLSVDYAVNAKTEAEYRKTGQALLNMGSKYVDGILEYSLKSESPTIRALGEKYKSKNNKVDLGMLYSYTIKDIRNAINSPAQLIVAADNFENIYNIVDSQVIRDIASATYVERLMEFGIDEDSAAMMAQAYDKKSLQSDSREGIINTGSDDNGLRNQGTVYGGGQERQATDTGTKSQNARSFQEDENSFLRRTSGDVQKTGRGRWVHVKYGAHDLAYAQKDSDNSSQSRAAEALNQIGIKTVFCDGPILTHKNGITTEHYEAMTAPDGTVYVSSGASLSSIEIAFHESVHSHNFRGTKEYAEYESIVCENIDYLSETYLSIAEQINQNQYGGKYDISEIENAQKFLREITAYINQFVATDPQYAKQLFGGMFENWEAVVNAAKTFSESIGLKTDNELFETLNSDSGAGVPSPVDTSGEVFATPEAKEIYTKNPGLLDDGLNPHQRYIQNIADKFGINLLWDKTGKVKTGKYNSNTKTIVLNPNMGIAEAYIFIFKHEFTHWLADRKGFENVKNYLLNKSSQFYNYALEQCEENGIKHGDSRSDVVNAYCNHLFESYKNSEELSAYERKHFTIENAQEEAVANFVARKLFGGIKTEEGYNSLMELRNENKGIIQTFIDFVKHLKNKIFGDKRTRTLESDLYYIEERLQQVLLSKEKATTEAVAEKHYAGGNGKSNIETQINQSMTMAECKDMIQRAFALGGIYDWYDGEYKNGDEWLKAQGADEVALYIENEYVLQQKYIDKIQGIYDDEFYVKDILEAYLKGTLIGKEKPKTKRLDISINHRINDTRFYSPQRIENVKQLFEVASQKLTSKNRDEVSNARAKILLFAHNKGASELLGLTQAELNKKLRTWGGYPAKAREMSRTFNNGVADSNKWTGIENCSWLYRSTVTTDELESLVKSVTGAANDYEKLYIARTMLALDTHIDWSWVSFEFDSNANINKNLNKNDRYYGFYSDDERKIVVSHNMPNTVAHEMGHALDYQWGRDLGYYGALTEISQNAQRITDPQTKQFFDNFKLFMDSLTDNGDIRSEYTQNPKEVFARFIARFVEWVDNTGTGSHSYRIELMNYNDKFTAYNYIEFVKLLQEKAMLDSKKVADRDSNYFSENDDISNKNYIAADRFGKAITDFTEGKITADEFNEIATKIDESRTRYLDTKYKKKHRNKRKGFKPYSGSVADLEKLGKRLKDLVGSNYDNELLVDELGALMSMADRTNVNHEELCRASRYLAEQIVDHQVPVLTEESKEMLGVIKATPFSLNNGQIAEIERKYGTLGKFKKEFRGKISIIDDAPTLDSVWGELVSAYPWEFDNDVSDAQLPISLIEKVESLENTFEEFEDSADTVFRVYNELMNEVIHSRRAAYEDDRKTQGARALAQVREEHRMEREAADKRHGSIYSIQRSVKKLDRMARKATNSNHLPEKLRTTIHQVINTFAKSSKGIFAEKELSQIRLFYKDCLENSEIGKYMNDELVGEIQLLEEILDGKSILDLSQNELDSINFILDYFNFFVTTENQEFIEKREAELEKRGNKAIIEIEESKGFLGNSEEKKLKGLRDTVGINNREAYYVFKQLGSVFEDIYWRLVEGGNRFSTYCEKFSCFAENVKDKHNYKTWADNIITVNIKGKEIKLTVEEALSVYAYAQRERSNRYEHQKHLLKGGLVFKVEELRKHLKKEIKDPKKRREYLKELKKDTTQVDERDINRIVNMLPEEALAYANDMIAYISTECAKQGNDVSMELYNYKKYREGFYFPFQVAEAYLETQEVKKTREEKLKAPSFTHSLQIDAVKPLAVRGFSTVVAEHVEKMANHNAAASAMTDLINLLNFTDDSGKTIKAMIEDKFGSAVLDYIADFVDDMNGGYVKDNRENVLTGTANNVKKARVLGNLSVIVQQPHAINRATVEIDYKYLMAAPKYSATWNEIKHYAPVAIIKEKGRYDVGLGVKNKDWLLAQSPEGFVDKVNDLAGKGPGSADKVAWWYLYKAVKAEIANTTELEVDSEEFKKAVGKRFTEIVYKTQVFDSTITKSSNMRSKSSFMQTATVYMAEPTKQMNVLLDAINDVKNGVPGSKKKLGRAVRAFIIEAAFNAASVALIRGVLRDDDEDESFIEKYLSSFVDVFLHENLNPLSKLPFAKDIVSLLEGWSLDRLEYEGIADVVTAFQKFRESLENGDIKEIGDALANLSFKVSTAFGLPFENVKRDLKGIYNLFKGNENPTTATGIQMELAEIFGTIERDADMYRKLYDLAENGDQVEFEKLYKYLKDEKGKSDSAIQKGLLVNSKESKNVKKEVEKEIELFKNSDMYDEFTAKHKDEAEKEIEKYIAMEDKVDKTDGAKEQYIELFRLKEKYGTKHQKYKEAYDKLIKAGKTEKQINDGLLVGEMLYIESLGVDVNQYILFKYATKTEYADSDGSGGVSKKEKYAAIDKLDVDKKVKEKLKKLI